MELTNNERDNFMYNTPVICHFCYCRTPLSFFLSQKRETTLFVKIVTFICANLLLTTVKDHSQSLFKPIPLSAK